MRSTTPILRDSFEQYLSEINRYPLLTREEEFALAKRFQETNDPVAAQRLVTANLRFVVKIAYQFKDYDIKVTDLVQEGNIGLMKAVRRFNPDRGYRLISYAVWWIKAYIQNYIIQSWSLVKVGPLSRQRRILFGRRDPLHEEVAEPFAVEPEAAEDAQAAVPAEGDLGAEIEVEVEPVEGDETFIVAAEKQSSTKPVASALAKRPTRKEFDAWRAEAEAARRDFSLDATLDEDSRMTFGDMLRSPDPSPEERLASEEITTIVGERLKLLSATLNEKERLVLETRLLADEPVTLQDLGDRFNISRERVRQIETNLKRKIAHVLEGVEPYGLLPKGE